jgi:hypothetical protein
LTDAQRVTIYLDDLELHGQMMRAATAAGRSLRYFQRLRKADPVFAKAEEAALAVVADLVRSEITRRAIEGTEVVTKGRDGSVIIRREYSDMLTLRLAEYLETRSWRQKQQVEHSGGIASLPTLADRKKRLADAKAAAAADEAASLAGLGIGPAAVKAEG